MGEWRSGLAPRFFRSRPFAAAAGFRRPLLLRRGGYCTAGPGCTVVRFSWLQAGLWRAPNDCVLPGAEDEPSREVRCNCVDVPRVPRHVLLSAARKVPRLEYALDADEEPPAAGGRRGQRVVSVAFQPRAGGDGAPVERVAAAACCGALAARTTRELAAAAAGSHPPAIRIECGSPPTLTWLMQALSGDAVMSHTLTVWSCPAVYTPCPAPSVLHAIARMACVTNAEAERRQSRITTPVAATNVRRWRLEATGSSKSKNMLASHVANVENAVPRLAGVEHGPI